ncbi:sigma-70 family RNA polymerase sigma factor [Myxococcus sp. K15C18031901]|uniref:RNA polymerase sigma factor n=1 Tax=Myxococcus dinghuensis TaxID=2906761 RepID=UPI0020A779B7|nr:sigma factor [Myxococcus dinghuensis]MCP3098439.1 sigma-70 family RNA polymerase sigma factor [Myxococcus dinghuensis]
MSFPTQAEEQALHERVLARRLDPVATRDVFEAFTEPIIGILCKQRGQTREDARDATIDVIYSYLNHPERFDPQRARLSTYLTQSAKKRVLDFFRSSEARQRREQEFGGVFELRAMTPKESMEITVEARLAVERLERALTQEKDRTFLKLVLEGERSTHILAEAMGLPASTEAENRREVKRNRDRLMKLLGRLRKEDHDV